MFKSFAIQPQSPVANAGTFVIPPETVDAGLNPPENTVIPTEASIELVYRFKPNAAHVIRQGANRFVAGTDFTLACDGNGQLTITWTNAGTPLAAAKAVLYVGLIDSITG